MRSTILIWLAAWSAALLPFVALFLLAINLAHSEPICQGTTPLVNYGKSGTVLNLNTIRLDAGHWDCVVSAETKSSNGVIQALQVSLSNSATGLGAGIPFTTTSGPNGGPGFGLSASTPPIRLDVTKQTTYYLNALIYYSSGTIQVKSDSHCLSPTLSN